MADCLTSLLLLVQLLLLFLVENVIPLGKTVEPVCSGSNHVLVQKFLVKSEAHFCILSHFFYRVRLNKTVVDTVQKSGHCHDVCPVFFGKLCNRTCNYCIRIGQKFLVNALFNLKIISPQFLEFIFILCLVVGHFTPFFK